MRGYFGATHMPQEFDHDLDLEDVKSMLTAAKGPKNIRI